MTKWSYFLRVPWSFLFSNPRILENCEVMPRCSRQTDQHRESWGKVSAVQNHLQTNINSWWEIMRLDWREIEDRLFVVSNIRLRTLTLAIWESLDSGQLIVWHQIIRDYHSERRAPLLLTWGSEIENHNLQIMSTLAKECGAKSQDGFTKARLTEFMPPSFDCQYKTLQQSSTAIVQQESMLEWIKQKISQNQS